MNPNSIAQLTLLDLSGKATKQNAEIQWLPIAQLDPHPDNPRLIYREDIIDTIKQSIKEHGFQPEYALLVRPLGDRYQIISGHTRHKAATIAGCAALPCWVKEMDDETAFMELVLANNQGELSPLELGMHVLKYVELSEVGAGKGNKGGLSEYARKIGKPRPNLSNYRDAAKIVQHCTFLNAAQLLDKASHLAVAYKAAETDWHWLITQLLENNWSVKDTEAAVAAITGLPEIPDWLQPVFDPDQCKRKAIQEERAVRDYNNWIATAIAEYEQLAEERPVNTVKDDKHVVEYWDLRSLFVQQLLAMKNPSAKRITECAAAVMEQIDKAENVYQKWLASKANDEEKRRIAEENQKRERLLKLKFAPTGYQGDIREVLPKLEAGSFDLVLTDPPYLLSNGGITCRGNSQTTVDKNFSDTEGQAVEPKDWMPECYRLLKPGGVLAFTLTSHLMASALQAAKEVGFEFLEDLIWAKRSAPPRLTPTGHRACHEYVLVFCKPGASHYFAYEHLTEKYWDGKQPSGVLEFEQCSGKERLGWHDTQKPLGLWTYLLEAYSREEATVLDPFGGSGTTAVVAKQTNRLCTWVELRTEFFEQAESRIEQTKFAWEQA